jgi:hypothetical protein
MILDSLYALMLTERATPRITQTGSERPGYHYASSFGVRHSPFVVVEGVCDAWLL